MTATSDINRERIAATEAVIRPHIRRTPLVQADLADFGLPAAPVTFKLEMLQHSGSFKARGAFANLLLRQVPQAGVVAASGGNHGAAVAYAAQRLGIPATIFVPDITSPAKAERIRGYGAKLVIAGDRYADALAASEAHVAQTGAMAVHAYDQAETLLGQGSVGLELEQDAPDIDTLLVAVGGGGLIGGIAAWYAGPDAHRRGRAGAIANAARRLRGGRAGRCAGRRPRRRQPRAAPGRRIDVSDRAGPCREGRAGQPTMRSGRPRRRLWSSLRVVAEPGGAAAFAALLSGRYRPSPGERVAVLVCGANTTAVNFGG